MACTCDSMYMCQARSMNVAFLPVYPNPYQRLLRDALAVEGVAVDFLESLPDSQWLRDNRGRVQILHYHWLSGLYMNRFLTPIQAVKFHERFRLARDLGYRTVWTAHNILPHRTFLAPLDRAIRRLVMANADAVITHCEHGRRELLSRFPRQGSIAVIPLGHYRDAYPSTTSRHEARERLSLEPDQFTYLALGNIAAYKGLSELVDAFKQVAGMSDVLLVAGRNRDQNSVSHLVKTAQSDGRIYVHPRFIPDKEMQVYLLAADVMVAPFKQVLTSSSVITGMSFDLPQIVPALGCLPELVTPDAGIVYDPQNVNGLRRALVDIKTRDADQMRGAVRRITDGLGWAAIGRQTADVYRSCLAS